MTGTRKPAAKKTTAAARKRTPRKKPDPKPVEVQAPSVQTIVLTEEQKQAKLEAYNALKSAGLNVPSELATEVEGWIAHLQGQREAEAQELAKRQAKHAQEIEEANQNGPWYVRNGYQAPFNLRLDRQTEKRRIELKARGTPGDLHPLKDEDLKDPILKQNLALGLIEIIPAGVAALVIEKQTTNMGQRVHTPLAILANERRDVWGRPDPGDVPVKMEAEFNSQGVTVAHIDPGVTQGQMHDRDVKRGGGITRAQPGQSNEQQTVHSGFVPTGGNPAIIQYGPHSMPNEAHAKAVDDLARRKGLQGPSAGLGDVQVVVEPVQRTT